MRTTMKGGVWKNSEDEILKAAVMKYGLNNWSRVASLLVRKSAKQCKSRWYEWLDPSVKKTEWTREEEEKLLHLAKLFPNQWRTIAPVVGRTAHQCLEHYDRLLDQAQGKTEEERINDPRRLRPGEIDPHPETKPSRADVVDMEDDEKEMLAEARARLANTRGKKAKRKAREKQLEEARRLAALQKRRELKAAGLNVGRWRRKDDAIDYATEIPFEEKPPKGFYAVGADETPSSIKGFGNILLQQLEGQRRIEEERRLRKEDTRKLKRIMEENPYEAIRIIEEANDATKHIFKKKAKLTLPEPQLSESELLQILSLGQPKAHGLGFTGTPSDHLLDAGANSSVLGGTTQLVTPMRTPAIQDTIMLAAKDAVSRTISETPLEGGTNPILSDVSLGTGAVPQRFPVQTPNFLASTSSLRSASVAGTPFQTQVTPYRSSNSSINVPESTKELQDQVLAALSQIPAPENEIEVQLPDNTFQNQLDNASAEASLEEDAEDTIRKQLELEELRRSQHSQAVRQLLPRPIFIEDMIIDVSSFLHDPATIPLETYSLIQQEMRQLICEEAVKFPLKGCNFTIKKPLSSNEIDDEFIQYLIEARTIVQAETNNPIEQEASEKQGLDLKEDQILEEFYNTYEIMYDNNSNSLIEKDKASKELQLKKMKTDFYLLKEQATRSARAARKLESKLAKLTQGYLQRAANIYKTIDAQFNEARAAEVDYEAYCELENSEQKALKSRQQDLKASVDEQKCIQDDLQKMYASLISQRENFQRKFTTVLDTNSTTNYAVIKNPVMLTAE